MEKENHIKDFVFIFVKDTYQTVTGALETECPLSYNTIINKETPMKLVAIFHHHSNNLPIVMEVSSTEKFRDCCDTIPTDWAHLMNKETGEITYTYRNKL